MSGLTLHRYARTALAVLSATGLVLAVCLTPPVLLGGAERPRATESDPITVTADIAHEWTEDGTAVTLLRGRCRITQGETVLRAQKMVLWRRTASTLRATRDQVIVYLEGDIRLQGDERAAPEPVQFVHLTTRAGVRFRIHHRMAGQPADHDPLYQRAEKRLRSSDRIGLRQTQFVVRDSQSGPRFPGGNRDRQSNLRRIRIFPRSAVRPNILRFQSEETTPPQQVWVLTGGINMIIEGVDRFGTVDLSADRMIVWTQKTESGEFQAETVQTRDTPLQVYMEGNIVIRQGRRTVRASRAFYDAREDRGLMLDAELETPLPNVKANLRVRADRVHQRSRHSFHAQNAWASTSKFGKPGYRLQATDVFLEDRPSNPWFGPGGQVVPLTGAPAGESVTWIESRNNTFLLDDVPLFYLPYLSAPAEDPNVPLRRVTVTQDDVFGFQIKTVWDMFKLLGVDSPRDVEWDLLGDFLSERGPAIGTGGEYRGRDLFGVPGLFSGKGLGYYVRDTGKDNLGRDRQSLEPSKDDRGRILWRHRQQLPAETTLLGEIGFLSDRNFLEQYYESEFNDKKDNETLLYLKQDRDNWSWSLLTRPRVNDFTTTTEWLPRADLYGLSEPLLGGWLTWSSHTSAGYAELEPGDPPGNPNDVFTPLPFVADREGAVLMSRHELDMPLNLGPLHVVPFALGEAAFWNQGFAGEEIDRFVGSAGVRSSLLAWRVFPYVQSRIFNLNGLAHKMVFETEYAWTDSTEDLSEVPQFNEFDDNAQERFRQRLVTNTFRGTLPPVFEPRFYAVRTGAGRAVTAPYHELIDDQQVVRLAWRQRLQTKVGPPQDLRIKDWMTLDLEASVFPRPERDNFGEDIGLFTGDYAWHVGDRTSVRAGFGYDFFNGAQQLWNLGLHSQRSRRGSVYVGIRQVKGAGLDSKILTTSASYRMSPKWLATAATAFDVDENQNRGQSLTITRIGADFLVHVGANFDAGKNNAGVSIAVEPRFAPLSQSPMRLGSLLNGGANARR